MKGEESRESTHSAYFQHRPGNRGPVVKQGRTGEPMGSILKELQLEAAYSTDVKGERGRFLVINIQDASRIPPMTEPLLLGVGATLHMQPVAISKTCGGGRVGTGATGAKVRLEPSA